MDKLKLLQDIGAIKKGHFLLTSGLHSDTYFEKFRLIERPFALIDYIKEDLDRVKNFDFDIILGPQFGGAFIAFAFGYLLSIKSVYAEKDVDGNFYIGRGFEVENKKILITDDVLTTGSSIKKVLKILEGRAEVRGIYVLIDRRDNKTDEFMGIPLIAGLKVSANTYKPEECPLCKMGVPLTTKKTGIIK